MNGKKAREIRKAHNVKHVRLAPQTPAQGHSIKPKFRITDEGEFRSDMPRTFASLWRPTPEKLNRRYYRTGDGDEIKFDPSNRGFTRPLRGGPSHTRGSQ